MKLSVTEGLYMDAMLLKQFGIIILIILKSQLMRLIYDIVSAIIAACR